MLLSRNGRIATRYAPATLSGASNGSHGTPAGNITAAAPVAVKPIALSTVARVVVTTAGAPTACRITRYAVADNPDRAANSGGGSDSASAATVASTATVAAGLSSRPTATPAALTAAANSAGPSAGAAAAATISSPNTVENAVAYAARHPERVSRLVLCGAYARGRAVRAVGDDEKRAAALDLDLARVGWGRDDPAFRQVFAAQFLPDGTRADWAAFDQLQRRTTSPENAVRFLEEFARIDVRDAASEVRCPTLIMHSRDDHRVPMQFGEELATLIPDSRLVALSSNNHLLTSTEPAWQVFCDELDAFLTE